MKSSISFVLENNARELKIKEFYTKNDKLYIKRTKRLKKHFGKIRQKMQNSTNKMSKSGETKTKQLQTPF